jgi:exonuclease III
LPQAIQRSNLVCVTAVDGIYRIDHICLSQTWADRVSHVDSWKDKSLSDHALVWVELTFE